jgi:hypothetical protein
MIEMHHKDDIMILLRSVILTAPFFATKSHRIGTIQPVRMHNSRMQVPSHHTVLTSRRCPGKRIARAVPSKSPLVHHKRS